jgi:hypothetical protein
MLEVLRLNADATRCKVVGNGFRSEQAKSLFKHLIPGSIGWLVSDPNNKHDSNAVNVYMWHEAAGVPVHVGYLPKDRSDWLPQYAKYDKALVKFYYKAYANSQPEVVVELQNWNDATMDRMRNPIDISELHRTDFTNFKHNVVIVDSAGTIVGLKDDKLCAIADLEFIELLRISDWIQSSDRAPNFYVCDVIDGMLLPRV